MLKMIGRMLIGMAIQRLIMMAVIAAVVGGGLMCSMNGGGIPAVPALGSLVDWSSGPRAELQTGPEADTVDSDERPGPTEKSTEVTVDTGFEVLTVPEVETATCTVQNSGPRREPENYTGEVVRISDGDTLVIDSVSPTPEGIEKDIRVRLWGIDAPERAQAGGDESLLALTSMTPQGSAVLVNKVGEDMYGRWLAVIAATADDTAVNTRLVAEGQAYFLSSFEARGNACLATAQVEAVASGVGVWANPNAERPWDYRHRTR